VIVNLRGTSGSGKTTAVRALLRRAEGTQAIYGAHFGFRMPEAQTLRLAGIKQPVFLIGPYGSDGCDGCDRIQPYALIPPLIEKYAARGHVVFEGLLISSCRGVIGEILERYEQNAVMLFLDTSLETCLQRIEARSGKPRDARLIKNVSGKYRSIERIEARVRDEGIIRAERVSDAAAAATIVRLLNQQKPEARM
jgi:hypothetical protein